MIVTIGDAHLPAEYIRTYISAIRATEYGPRVNRRELCMSEEVPRTAALIDVSGVSLENLRRLDSVALRRVLDGLREGDEETLAAFDSAT